MKIEIEDHVLIQWLEARRARNSRLGFAAPSLNDFVRTVETQVDQYFAREIARLNQEEKPQ